MSEITAQTLRGRAREAIRRRATRRPRALRRDSLEQEVMALLSPIPDLVAEFDVAGRIRYVSPSVRQWLGHTPAQLLGHSILEVAHPSQHAHIASIVRRFWQGEALTPEELRIQVRRADGGWTVQDITPFLRRDDRGAPIGIAIVARDVTVQVDESAARAASERLLGRVSELSGVGAWRFNPQTGRLALSDVAQRALGKGVAPPQTQEEALAPLCTPQRRRLTRLAARALRRGKGWEVDIPVTADGVERVFRLSGMRIAGRDGAPRLIGAIQDITRERRARDDLRNARDAARRALGEAEIYRAVLDSRALVVITDAEGRIELVNEMLTVISDRPLSYFIGRHVSDLTPGPANPSIYTEIWETAARGETWSGEFNAYRVDGAPLWLDGFMMPVRDRDGRVERYIAACFDVTERHKAQQRDREASDRLAQAAAEAELRAERDRMLAAILEDALEDTPTELFLDAALAELGDCAGRGWVLLGDETRLRVASGLGAGAEQIGVGFDAADCSTCTAVTRERHTLRNPGAVCPALWAGAAPMIAARLGADGRMRGVLLLEDENAAAALADLDFLARVADMIGLGLRRRESEAALRRARDAADLAHRRLDDAVAAMPDGFAVFDGDDRLVACNDVFADFFPGGAETAHFGARADDMLRAFAASGSARGLDEEVDVYVARRMAQRRAGATYEQELSDGRWMQVIDRTTSEGGTVSLRIDITAMKENEARLSAALAQSTTARQNLLDAVNSLPDGFALFDEQERLLLCNERFRALADPEGGPVEIGARYIDIAGASARKQARGDSGYVEARRPDGGWTMMIDQPTSAGGVVSLRIDITEMKRVEARLRAALDEAQTMRQRLEDAVAAMPDGFGLYDAQDTLVLCNERFSKASPRAGDIIRMGADFNTMCRELVAAGVLDTGGDSIEDYVARRQRDRQNGVDAEVQTVEGAWLKAIDRPTREGGIVSLRLDVTGSMQQKVALQQALAEAETARQRLEDAVRALPDGFGLFDSKDRLVIFNSQFHALHDGGSGVVRPGARYADILRAMIANGALPQGKGREDAMISEIAALRRGGATRENQGVDGRWLRHVDRPTREGGVVSLRIDITEHKNHENFLSLALDAAEAAAEAKSQFLANISHEIRTPMNGVIGMLELMLMCDLPNEQRDRARIARDSARHLLALLNDVLDFSKLEAGHVELEDIALAPAAIIRDVAALFAQEARKKGLTLDADICKSAPDWIRGDPTRLRQVLVNLVGNAVKFTAEGSVTMRAVWREERLRIEVIDTGPGVAPGLRAKLFERFSQADSSTTRRFGGTGLGLAICRELVLLMGGEIGVESAEGGGALFWFTLPARRAAPAPAAAAPSAAAPLVASRPLRILLAEDNPVNREVILQMLTPQGHRLEVAVNGQEAVALAARGRFDLILMDVRMPKLDGFGAARRIRSLPGARGAAPIYALTADASSAEELFAAAGMQGKLVKPIDFAALAALLAAVADQAEAPAE